MYDVPQTSDDLFIYLPLAVSDLVMQINLLAYSPFVEGAIVAIFSKCCHRCVNDWLIVFDYIPLIGANKLNYSKYEEPYIGQPNYVFVCCFFYHSLWELKYINIFLFSSILIQ